jgi:SAM-dependent methyltransferase
MTGSLYDRIGLGYASYRTPDPRIAAKIDAALGDASTVLNVGAGTGSYEPSNRKVVAVEPSEAMIRQRRLGSAPAVRAVAERLPFATASFDAGLAVLTLHHWSDWQRGISELQRVSSSRVVLFTWDPGFWLVQDYFLEVLLLDRLRFPPMHALAKELGVLDVQSIPIPKDCTDGFLGAYWCRPSAYLDKNVRGAISGLADVESGDPRLLKLSRDLEDGTWQRRHGELLALTELDLGYRIVIARGGSKEEGSLNSQNSSDLPIEQQVVQDPRLLPRATARLLAGDAAAFSTQPVGEG